MKPDSELRSVIDILIDELTPRLNEVARFTRNQIWINLSFFNKGKIYKQVSARWNQLLEFTISTLSTRVYDSLGEVQNLDNAIARHVTDYENFPGRPIYTPLGQRVDKYYAWYLMIVKANAVVFAEAAETPRKKFDFKPAYQLTHQLKLKYLRAISNEIAESQELKDKLKRLMLDE